MTESPRRNILEMNLSLLTGRAFDPSDFRGISVHISFTFSRTMLQCRSNALTRASSFRLFRHEIKTWLWVRTAVCKMLKGPALNSYFSSSAISYSVRSERGLSISVAILRFKRLDVRSLGHISMYFSTKKWQSAKSVTWNSTRPELATRPCFNHSRPDYYYMVPRKATSATSLAPKCHIAGPLIDRVVGYQDF